MKRFPKSTPWYCERGVDRKDITYSLRVNCTKGQAASVNKVLDLVDEILDTLWKTLKEKKK